MARALPRLGPAGAGVEHPRAVPLGSVRGRARLRREQPGAAGGGRGQQDRRGGGGGLRRRPRAGQDRGDTGGAARVRLNRRGGGSPRIAGGRVDGRDRCEFNVELLGVDWAGCLVVSGGER